MKFARWVFLIAGIYGLLALAPQYLMERQIGVDHPPSITHAEYFYGFVGVGLAWQVAFLIIATDPARYRLLMIPSILEKVSFGAAVILLYLNERVGRLVLGFSLIDLMFALLFGVAFRIVGEAERGKAG